MRTPIVSWRSDPPVLSVYAVEALQRITISPFGGMHGLRDRGLLKSAVARAENLAYYNPEVTVSQIAATLARGLIKNHAFINLNGCKLTCSEAEETAMVLRAATSEIDEAVWTARVERSVGPL